MAGTISISEPTITSRGNCMQTATSLELEIAFIADAVDGTIPTLALSNYSAWYIQRMVWVPGVAPTGVAPTDLTDFTLPDGDGIDALNGAGLNLPAVGAKEEVMTRIIPVSGVTATIVQPAVATNSATGTIRLFLGR